MSQKLEFWDIKRWVWGVVLVGFFVCFLVLILLTPLQTLRIKVVNSGALFLL